MVMTKNPTIIDFINFLDASPTAWHAVENVAAKLTTAGFEQMDEADAFPVKLGGKYFVIRNGSSLMAFSLPKQKTLDARIIGTHTDSPGLKIKPRGEFQRENMVMLGVEPYGSPIYAAWVNRDLGIAGRVAYEEAGQVKQKLVTFDNPSVFIPQLAIHFDRTVNENGLKLNPQDQLCALAALSASQKGAFLNDLIHAKIGKTPLAFDLFLYPLEKARLSGELITSARLDNLSSVHAALTALIQASEKPGQHLQIGVFWDNEEVGSRTAQGAQSPFFQHTLERVCLALTYTREEYLQLLNRSFCISADMAHAINPNSPEKHDARHPVLLGQGVALKTNADHRYASDADAGAWLHLLCKKHKIPLQVYNHRSDLPCGTTIGPIHSAVTGIKTVDVGTPQLSMHSTRELAAVSDHLDLCRLLEVFLN